MLNYVDDDLVEDDREAILTLVLDTASYREWWRVSGWIHAVCARWSNERFEAHVRALVWSEVDDDRIRGLRLLPHVLRSPLDAGDRHHLEPIVVEAAHGRGPGAGLVESLS